MNHTTLKTVALRILENFVRILFSVNISLNENIVLALCETNLDDSIDSSNLSVKGYLPLTQKDSFTHMPGLAIYVKEELPFAQALSLENSADSYLCFRLALLHSVSCFSFLYQSLSLLLSTVFHSVSSKTEEFVWINPSGNVFVLGDFSVYHKDWLNYSGRTGRPGELCYNFSISKDLTQMVNLPTPIPDCDCHGPAIYLYLLMLAFVLQWLSLH